MALRVWKLQKIGSIPKRKIKDPISKIPGIVCLRKNLGIQNVGQSRVILLVYEYTARAAVYEKKKRISTGSSRSRKQTWESLESWRWRDYWTASMKSHRHLSFLGWLTLFTGLKPPHGLLNGGSRIWLLALIESPILSRSESGIGISILSPLFVSFTRFLLPLFYFFAFYSLEIPLFSSSSFGETEEENRGSWTCMNKKRKRIPILLDLERLDYSKVEKETN